VSEQVDRQLGESLSALLDGEANELDLQRVLQNSDDESVRVSWHRYHMSSYSMRSGDNARLQGVDLSQRIMAALDEEAPHSVTVGARWKQFIQPAASFAVAASVFAAVLVGSQFYSLLGSDSGAASLDVASRGAPIGLVNSVGGAAMQAGFAAPAVTRTPAAGTDYDAMARARLERFRLSHTQQAALNSPQGMMPYAKVASFTTED